MGDKTEIAWCDSTFNPWVGCQAIGPGCDHCYAHDWAKRYGRDFATRTRTTEANWRKPITWNKKQFYECPDCGWRGGNPNTSSHCQAGFTEGLPSCPECDSMALDEDATRRVFCASLADWLDNEVPIEWLADLLDLIKQTPDLNWLLLTKRIGNFNKRIQQCIGYCYDNLRHDLGIWLTNWLRGYAPGQVWLGITVVNQEEADRDIPKLLRIPAHIRWLSMEPLLGSVCLRLPTKTWDEKGERCNHCCNGDRCDDISHYYRPDCPYCRGTGKKKIVDWVVVGGESGSGARPMNPEWSRSLRDQCGAAGVKFLFKQWGQFAPNWLNDDDGNKIPASEWMDPVGKKKAGRILEGRTWDQYPG